LISNSGKSAARHLVSCRHITSCCASSRKASKWGSRALTELTFQLAIFTARRRDENQPIEKELPQPQDEAAFGFLIWNEAPIRSSTKSISAPFKRPSETSSTTTPTPSRSNTKSSSLRWSSNDNPY